MPPAAAAHPAPAAASFSSPASSGRASSGVLYLAGLAVIGYKVVTFDRWSDEYPYLTRFLACFAVMVVELLWENVMVW